MTRIILIGLVAVLVAGGAWFFLAKGNAATSTAVNASDVSWQYTNAGEDSTGAPQTKVSLAALGNKTYQIGTYPGSCSPVATLFAGEISGVLCWWAGGGTELGVFKEGDKYTIKEGIQDEGSAETAGFRGNFKTLFILQ